MNNTYLTTDYGNGNTRPNQNWGSNSSLNHGDLRQEEEMAMAIKKALTPEDAAPKQKHIRSIILYTWDSKGSGYLWDALKSYPMVICKN